MLNDRKAKILSVVAATLGILSGNALAQTEWEKCPVNPVLDIGSPGSWDDYHVVNPYVLFDGTEYKMWYTGNSGTRAQIGYANSEDGIVWHKHPDSPVLNVGPSGAWDGYYIGNPCVIFDGAMYKMWYTGNDGIHSRIGYATSVDGIVWERYPGNPVLGLGANGTWDDYYVNRPRVLFDGTEYKMWYAGLDGTHYRIGYATSPDGIAWDKHPDNPVLDLGPSGTWSNYHVAQPYVLFNGTQYEMWYAGYDSQYHWRIGYATSPDGVVWEKHPDNPVLDLGADGTWDDYDVRTPCVLFDGTEYKMWYSGSDGSHERIGYATSSPLVAIDIKPGAYPNSINLGSQGLIPVAILSSTTFDATQVDPDTVQLAGAGVAIRGKGNKLMAHEEDANGDGLTDLVVQVETENLDPGQFQDGYAVLTGQTYGGDPIEGSDEITIVPPEAAPAGPSEFEALEPYPKPANPEVWIPYRLAEGMEVTITIYNTRGQLIRTLALGYQPAGAYIRKDKAAYWDGRNEAGEHVASGVYFCTIQAGNLTATKKLVLAK